MIINMSTWLSRCTLDIIGLAGELYHLSVRWTHLTTVPSGFGYEFNSLQSETGGGDNSLFKSISAIARSGARLGALQILKFNFPVLNLILVCLLYPQVATCTHSPLCNMQPDFIGRKERVMNREADQTLKEVGNGLVAQKKKAILERSDGDEVEKGQVEGKDLLSALSALSALSDPVRELITTFAQFVQTCRSTSNRTNACQMTKFKAKSPPSSWLGTKRLQQQHRGVSSLSQITWTSNRNFVPNFGVSRSRHLAPTKVYPWTT